MRVSLLTVPITLALSAPLASLANETARVLFCAGDCYAVDTSTGARMPAPKGTPLVAGQRLETGPGSYAQVKLGTRAVFGIGDRARVRLEPNGLMLDEGRIRVVGDPGSRPVELRTDDSTFVLRGADIDMKKSGPSGPASPVLVKLNAGDASVSGAALANGGMRLVTAGSVIPGKPVSGMELVPSVQGTSSGPMAQAEGLPGGIRPLPGRLAPVSLPPLRLPLVAKAPLHPTLTLPKAPEPPVLPLAPRLLSAPVINTTTGEITTLYTAVALTVQPTYTYTAISPTLLDPSLTSSLSTSTSTSLSSTTLSAPVLTTTNTTYSVLSSPTLSTSTLIRK